MPSVSIRNEQRPTRKQLNIRFARETFQLQAMAKAAKGKIAHKIEKVTAFWQKTGKYLPVLKFSKEQQKIGKFQNGCILH